MKPTKSTIGGILTYLVAIISILIGVVLFTPIPKQLGVYRWYATHMDHSFIGFAPAFLHDIPYGFTLDELYSLNLTGQRAIVTGANSGIGYAMTKVLLTLGADVIMTCRNVDKCNAAAESIRSSVGSSKEQSSLTTMILDTNSLASVRDFSVSFLDQQNSLEMLFLNAGGVGYLDKVNKKCVPPNSDNIETTFATNFVGHHLLFRYLQPVLESSKHIGRVVSTTSMASYRSYTYLVATNRTALNGCLEPYEKNGVHYSYGQSKLAQLFWTKYVATNVLRPNSNIYINAFHPGIVSTNIFYNAFDMIGAPRFLYSLYDWLSRETFWTPIEGALTGLYLGTNTDALIKQNIRGQYYHPQSIPIFDHPYMNATVIQQELWYFAEELVQDFLPKNDV
jgi:retinol dehydrogenase 13